ncbi:MAG: hypothetical protein UU31_C0011G0010 [Candidatus Uhrbacteria bacterium GW2011_GWA2_41_10]|nr:MAG: hypothetical protein UU31_C0011G0010 [Candidatus Uhrbacteria bacterium GW2011_GWA2_41_10]
MFSSVRRTRSFFAAIGQHIVSLNVACLGCMVLLILLSIIQVNRAATKGYQIRELEKHISQLKLETQVLETTAAEQRSMETVHRKVQMLGMVKTDQTHYVGSDAAALSFHR